MFCIGMAMKHITNDYQGFGFKVLDEANEPLHIFSKNRGGNCNAGFSEVAGFAQMQIRQDQDFPILPKNTSLG